MTDEIPSDQTTTIEISGDNDEKQQDFITPKPEKEIPTKTGTKSAQQLAAERKQREAERALRDTERAKKRLSMRTKIAAQKNKASDPLLRLYQFAYESMTNMDSINPTQIKEEWDSVVESFSNARALKTINCAPDSMETLLTAMSQILSKSQRKGGDENVGQIEDETMNKKKLSEENETINDTLAPLTVSDHDAVSKEEIVSPVHKRPKDDKSKFDRSRNAEIVPNSDDTKSNEPEDTNTDSDDNALGQKLYKLCAEDQVDEAIMLILRYKLKDDNHSALAICKCEVFKYAIERVYPRFMGSDIDSDSDEDEPDSDSDEDEPGKCVDGKDIVHPEKPEINQHDEYQHSMRRLFLFKMLLKEGASIYGLLEGEFPRDETVWGTYWKSIAECKDGDAVDLLFQCGVGIHDVNHKEGTKDGNHKFKEYTAWTPIQEAILQRNVPLMKHLLKAGAKSNGYFMKFFKHRDWRLPLTALCPTAICAFWTVTWQYLESKRDDNGFQILKCFLKHCDPKVNGFPNVNHYTFIRDRVLKEKPPSPPPKEENVHVPMSVVDGVSVTSSGLRPQPYQCRLSPGDRYRLEQIRKGLWA